jgi:uncharacterized protein YyaL (SSP411 family)
VDGAVDPTVYTDWNGTAVSAMLQAARVFEDEGLRDFAIRSLERVVLQSYRPGAGVAHYVDGAAQARGLLDDQVAMIHAHLDAHALTGDIVYEMMAEELGHFVLRTLQDDRAGGLFDRSIAGSDVGRLRRRLKPFVGNCEAAAALGRLAAASGETPFLDAARRALAAVAAAAPAHGPQAACHPLALRAIERG